MAETVLTAVDTIHKYVNNIPADSPDIQQVNGYVTQVTPGSDIEWDQADWNRFPKYVEKTIAQLPANDPSADILDVEQGAAWSEKAIVDWVRMRHAAQEPAHIYISKDNVPRLDALLTQAHLTDQVYLWLADWNLSEAEARLLLGTEYSGFRVEMVQWASPTSNPNTLLPGTNYTLADSGCDLSVAIPFSGWNHSKPHLVSVLSIATFSDGSRKTWSV